MTEWEPGSLHERLSRRLARIRRNADAGLYRRKPIDEAAKASLASATRKLEVRIAAIERYRAQREREQAGR